MDEAKVKNAHDVALSCANAVAEHLAATVYARVFDAMLYEPSNFSSLPVLDTQQPDPRANDPHIIKDGE